MKKNDWIYSLKERVEESSSLQEPKVSWDELEANMDRITRMRRTHWIIGGISVVAAVVCAFLLLPRHTDELVPIAVVESGHDDFIAENTTDFVQKDETVVEKVVPIVRKENCIRHDAGIDVSNEIVAQEDDTVSVKINKENGAMDVVCQENKQSSCSENGNALLEMLIAGEKQAIKKKNRVSLSFGSGVTGAAFSGRHSQQFFVNDVVFINEVNNDNLILYPANSYNWSNFPENLFEKPVAETKATLDRLASFGISANCKLSKRCFITGGAEVAYYRAFFEKSYSYENVLYVGPSIGIGIDIFRNEKNAVYAAAVGTAEWCIGKDNYPALVSAALTAGVQRRLGKVVWIYLEPQLRYYFIPDGNRNISMQHPFDFSASIGLKFDL